MTDETPTFVAVPLNTLTYAYTALSSSADNGDRYCARQIAEALEEALEESREDVSRLEDALGRVNRLPSLWERMEAEPSGTKVTLKGHPDIKYQKDANGLWYRVEYVGKNRDIAMTKGVGFAPKYFLEEDYRMEWDDDDVSQPSLQKQMEDAPRGSRVVHNKGPRSYVKGKYGLWYMENENGSSYVAPLGHSPATFPEDLYTLEWKHE